MTKSDIVYAIDIASCCLAYTYQCKPIPNDEKIVFFYHNKTIPPEGFIKGKFIRLFEDEEEAMNWLKDR